MKKIFLLITSLVFLTTIAFSQSKVNINNLVQYGDKMFKENDDTPFTGIVFDMSKETGNKVLESKYVQGLPHGKHSEWWPNENKKVFGTYKSGMMNSYWTFYYGNGNIKCEGSYKNGNSDEIHKKFEIPKNGMDRKWIFYYLNGQKEEEGNYKDGKKHGKYTYLDENGLKRTQGNYKNGEEDGLWTYYRKDGSNETEGYFENGVKTHKWWYWDENGKYYYVIRIVLESDIITLLKELASKRDDQLEGVLNNIAEEYLYKDPNSSIFTVFEKEVSIRNIKLSQYYHLYGASADEIITALKIEVDNAINRIVGILQNRLDQFGVAEQTIQKQGSHRIIVELAGVQDSERARTLLESTGLLEFFLVKDVNTTGKILLKIDQALKENKTIADAIESASVEEAEETKESDDQTVSVSELFGETQETSTPSDSPVVDEEMFSERPFSSMLRNLGQTIGVSEKNAYAVKKILKRPEVQEKLAAVGGTFLFSHKAEEYPLVNGTIEKMYSLYLLEDKVELTGEIVEVAKANLGLRGSTSVGQPIVNLTMNSDAARKWSIVTGSNVGHQVATVLDNKVHMTLNIREKISNGRTLIEGFANINEAKDIAIVIRAGALPAPVDIIEERIVKKYVNK